LRSPEFAVLLAKEWHELLASRAYWILLFVIGPLVGQASSAPSISMRKSVVRRRTSRLVFRTDGRSTASWCRLSEVYDLAVTLLFSLRCHPLGLTGEGNGRPETCAAISAEPGTTLAAKGLIRCLGWFIAWLPGLVAIGLLHLYGGHLYAPEVLNLLLGHLLRLLLSCGIAVAACGAHGERCQRCHRNPCLHSGTWALEFVGHRSGRICWQQIAAYTPTAALRSFEQGLFRLNTTGRDTGHHGHRLHCRCDLVAHGAQFAGKSAWHGRNCVHGRSHCDRRSVAAAELDFSENRRNSFPAADEGTLAQFREPLNVTVYLAAEDPRLVDLERNILSKLSRTVPRLQVAYAVGSRTGLFERADDHYGEVWYALGDRKTMTHSATRTDCPGASVSAG